MEKHYTKIECWGNVENAVQELVGYSIKNHGRLACCEFNGVTLYSDTVSLDSAYREVTGKSYFQFNEDQKAWHKEYDRKEAEHKAAIPDLTQAWIKKGHEILSEDKWDYWDKIVPIRLGDLYHGMELGNCLDIVQILNEGCSLDEARQEIENQNHSGMSFGLVRSMVREFSDRGNEFSEYVN